jgi:hypothetical protein
VMHTRTRPAVAAFGSVFHSNEPIKATFISTASYADVTKTG